MVVVAPQGLVGRDEELRRLGRFLDSEAGEPGALIIQGEAGVGKTSVWGAALDLARARGFAVLRARPAEFERELSYAALGDLLSEVHDEIGLLPGPQRRALRVALLLDEPQGVPVEQRAVAVALSSLLELLAEGGKLVVAVDDAQWLDEASLSAVRFALRRADAAALFSCRTPIDGPTLDDADVLAVLPLGLADLGEVIRLHLDVSFRRRTLLEVERTSGGNPFFALELARALIARRLSARSSDLLPIPQRLRELVAARLDRLTPAGRAAALLTAAAMRPTEHLLERVAGSGLNELFSAGVLVRDGERVRFAHPLLAATVYSSASTRERSAAHRALVPFAENPEEKGRHLAAAADGQDAEAAVAVSAAAAHARARGAVDAAAQLAARAVELTPPDEVGALHRRRLFEADAWIAAGEPHRARSTLEDAVGQLHGRQRGEVFCALALLATNVEGDEEAAIAAVESGLAALAPEDADLRAKLEIARYHAARYILGRYDDADAALREAAKAAEAANDDAVLSRVLSARFFAEFVFGRGDDLPLIRRAIELLEQRPPDEEQRDTDQLWALYHYANYLSDTDQTAAAREIYARLRDRARALGDLHEAHYLELMGVNEFQGCCYDNAIRYAREAEQLSRQTGYPASGLIAIALSAHVQIYRGELGDVPATLARLRDVGQSVDPAVLERLQSGVLALVAFCRGDYQEAHEQFVTNGGTILETDPATRPRVPFHVEALIALGRFDEAAALLDPFERLARTNDRPVRLAGALRSRALLHAARRDFPSARRAFEEALLQHDRLDNPFERARTLLAYGSFSLSTRKQQRARELLSDADATFGRLGCPSWAERAQGELSRLGGRSRQTRALTATEVRVATLVARGRSNAAVGRELFMSPKTVEWNLSKIYKKLGVSSRTELAAKLAKQSGRR